MSVTPYVINVIVDKVNIIQFYSMSSIIVYVNDSLLLWTD